MKAAAGRSPAEGPKPVEEVPMDRFIAKPFIAAAFAMLLGSTALSTAASADSRICFTVYDDEDGTVTTVYQDNEDGHYWLIEISADGNTYTVYDSNPNPNDDATGKGSHSDKPDVVGLLKSGAATYTVKIAPADSPELMAHLQSVLNGAGLGPHYNPGDDDNRNGPGAAPTHSMTVRKTDAEIRSEIATANEIANALANLEGSMGDGDEGSGEGPNGFNKNGPGNPGDDDGNYTEGQDKTVGKTEKDLLGPKPEYVNPPHWGDAATHGDGHASTGGGSAGGGSAHAGGLSSHG